MIRAILFDQGDTLWLCLALCGMNPAASVKAADFNPQESYLVDGPKAGARGAESMPQPLGWGRKPGPSNVGATFRSPAGGLKASPTFRYLVNDHKASATLHNRTFVP